MVGTTGNDTFTGTFDAAANSDTINVGDSVDGGAGIDTFVIASNKAAGAGTPNTVAGITLKNIEQVQINNTVANATAGATTTVATSTGLLKFDGSVAPSLTKVDVTGVGDVQVVNFGTAAIGVKGVTSNNGATQTVTVAGATTINIEGTTVGKAANSLLNIDASAGTGTAAAKVVINSNGTTANAVSNVKIGNAAVGADALTVNAAADLKTTITEGVANTLKTVTISGTAPKAVDLGTLASTALTSVDASGLTAAGAKVGIGDNVTTTFKGGAGNDTVTIKAGAVMTGTVDAGAGTADVLAISDTFASSAGAKADTSLTTATGKLFSNFEILKVSANTGGVAGVTADTVTFDTSLLTASTLTATQVGASNYGVKLANLAANPSVTIVGDQTSADGLTLAFKTPSATNADVVNLALDNQNTVTTGNVAGVAASALTVGTSVATLNIASNGSILGTGAANTITALNPLDTGLKQINITGNQALSLTTGALTKSFNIDGSTATGQLTINASAATAATTAVNINGGSNNDTIQAATATTTATSNLIYGAGGGDSIILGGGHTAKNTLVYKAASDSLLDVVGVSGAGTVAAANVGKMDVITNFISGTDKVDLSAFSFAGASKGAIINASYTSNAAMVSAVNGAAATGFFNDATSTARGVKVVADGTDTFVFVDTNHDGNFAASSDLVIKLAGVVAPVIGDFTF